MKKKVLFAAAFMLATVGAYAQGNGIAGITEATNMVTSYFENRVININHAMVDVDDSVFKIQIIPP